MNENKIENNQEFEPRIVAFVIGARMPGQT